MSTIGKILIIKSLIIPQFTYLASVTSIKKQYIKELENEIYNFIWDGKRDKVKRLTLIADYDKGGLNMIDIKSYFNTLKVKWVSRLINTTTEHWTLIPRIYFNKFGNDFLLFRMNLDKKNFTTLNCFKELPEFYQDIVKNWFDIKNETSFPSDFKTIRKEIIWGNRYITYKNKPLIWKNWIKSNIIHINDIVDENGIVSENEILKKLVNKTNWIAEFNMLKQALPKTWKKALKTEESRMTKVNINEKETKCIKIDKFTVPISELTNEIIYNQFLNNKVCSNIGLDIWTKKLNVSHYQINKMLKFIHKHIFSNKLKVYRWKLASFILPTQENLFKWKINQSPHCRVCKCNDNYKHFFIECKCIQEFWKTMEQKLAIIHFCKKVILKNIVVGYKIDEDEFIDFNIIFTIIGFSIYKAFYMSEQRTKSINVYTVFKNEFKEYFNFNRIISASKSTLIRKLENAL